MTLIQRHNGELYNLLDAGIRTRDVIISSPTPENNLVKVEGSNGVIDYGTTYGPRDITCYYRAQSKDFIDFSLLRDEIFHLFRTEESFYLIEKRERGKRWLVKVGDPYSIPQRNIFGNFEVNVIGLRGIAESIDTTQDIQKNGISYNEELWGYGMGLLYDDESHKYTHTGTSFRIYNAGNVPIHPFEQRLKITISNVQGSGAFLQLRNNTNGSVFRVNEAVTSGKTIVINGPVVTINSLQEFRKTNRKYIELEPGWNDFTLTGATSAKVEFDFPFYYF